MKFSESHRRDEPEINLIPFIDVLLVVVIFLVLTTTYSRFTELQVTLPSADAETLVQRPREILVGVSAEGRVSVDRQTVPGAQTVADITRRLAEAASGAGDTLVIVSADAAASHQSVINVLDAARRAGLARLTFAAQARPQTP
jgi:biopolymer transport protein ExbD